MQICGIEASAVWKAEFAKPLSGLPRGAERHAKKPKTYTVSYTYTQTILEDHVKTRSYDRPFLTQNHVWSLASLK